MIDEIRLKVLNDAGCRVDFVIEKVKAAIERLRKVATGESGANYAIGTKGIYLHTDLAMVLDWQKAAMDALRVETARVRNLRVNCEAAYNTLSEGPGPIVERVVAALPMLKQGLNEEESTRQ